MYRLLLQVLVFSSVVTNEVFHCPALLLRRLLLAALWPVVVLLVITIASVSKESARYHISHPKLSDSLGTSWAAAQEGVQRIVPAALLITFVLVPSRATQIFQTFKCDSFAYSPQETRRYLNDDLSVDCDSPEYAALRTSAFILVFVWPMGVPILYVLLLWASRKSIQSGERTTLSHATEFLYDDYRTSLYWWEPLEMCRKLVLTGWVLLINEEAELARVLLAILLNLVFLCLQFSLRPFRRLEWPRAQI